MKKWTKWVSSAAVAVLATGTIVGLSAFGWPFFGKHARERFMQHMVDAHVQDVLDEISATPDQRTKVSAMEAKLIGDFKNVRKTKHDLMAQLSQIFPKEAIEGASLDAAAAPLTQAEQVLKDDVRQAVIDLHDLLTPAQRQKLADHVAQQQQRWGDE